MPVPQRLSIVTLGVTDVEASTRFYESLGWRRSAASQPTITFFAMQGSVLALYGAEPLADDAVVSGALPDSAAFRGVTCAITFDDPAEVDAAFTDWCNAGARPVKVPEPAFWGGYSGYVADPDGHLWELAHNPYSPNGPDGRMQLP